MGKLVQTFSRFCSKVRISKVCGGERLVVDETSLGVQLKLELDNEGKNT